MPATLEFAETDDSRLVRIEPSEARVLRRLTGSVVFKPVDDHHARLGPRKGYVGAIRLPTGRRIIVTPKADIDNVNDLLALAWRKANLPESVGVDAVDRANPSDWVILQFAAATSDLTRQGLRRGYVDQREILPYVRGRMRPVLNPAVLPLVDCEFSEFVMDTPENRALKGVLESVRPFAASKRVRDAVRDALAAFGQVGLVPPNARDLEAIRLTRLNEYYAPSLHLARVILEGMGTNDARGRLSAPAFFVLMWKVWQDAVAQSLEDAGLTTRRQVSLPRAFVQVDGQPTIPVNMSVDVVLGPRRSPRAIVEVKWSKPLVRHRNRWVLKSNDLRQAATYARALDCTAWLVYPRFDRDLDMTYDHLGVPVRVRTVDLSTPSLGGLHSFADDVVSSKAG